MPSLRSCLSDSLTLALATKLGLGTWNGKLYGPQELATKDIAVNVCLGIARSILVCLLKADATTCLVPQGPQRATRGDQILFKTS